MVESTSPETVISTKRLESSTAVIDSINSKFNSRKRSSNLPQTGDVVSTLLLSGVSTVLLSGDVVSTVLLS